MSKVTLFTNIQELLTLKGAVKKGARRVLEKDLGIIKNAAMVCHKGRVLWVGPQKKLSKNIWKEFGKPKEISLKSGTVMPAFVECHTHLVFAGNRADEFEMRTQGASYQEIAKKGGGILSTVRATRKAKEQDLIDLAQERADRFIRQGVTTLEIKSGYGLDLKTETKILRTARQLQNVRTVATYLGLHAVPPEFADSESYLVHVIDNVLPILAQKKLIDRVDAFVDEGYFSTDQARRYFQAARAYGFKVSAHVEQLTRQGGTEVAIEMGALSADHVVQVSKKDIQKLAESETTGVLLPAADFYLQMNYPPARDLIEAGARVALATDYNPGSSPTQDLSLVGMLARLEMKMSLPEVIVAYTLGAAHALDHGRDLGALLPGRICDFVVIDGSWRDLFYQVGFHPVGATWKQGKNIFQHR